MHDGLDDAAGGDLHEPELRPGEAQQRQEGARALPGERWREQAQARDALGVKQPDLERHAPAEAVADEADAVDLQRVEQVDGGAGEEARVIGGADGLVGVAEPGLVDGDDAEAIGERDDGGDEGALRGAEAVQGQDRRAGAGFQDRQARPVRGDAAKAQASRLGVAARGGQEADADVHVAAHLQPARAIGVHGAADVARDLAPGPGVGREHRVGAPAG